MNLGNTINRRRCERFTLPPMHTGVSVWQGDSAVPMHGHAYDISERGVRIELDERLAPGTDVAFAIYLPGKMEPVTAYGTVIWCFDVDDDPGPARLAIQVRRYQREIDQLRLLRYLGEGALARAA